jgi:hypothetical protein
MARYILIDNISGYIFGDSADLNGKIFVGTPEEFAAALDASIRLARYCYELDAHKTPRATETGYRVYRADINGSDAVGNFHWGRDTIDAVERDCRYEGFISYRTI